MSMEEAAMKRRHLPSLILLSLQILSVSALAAAGEESSRGLKVGDVLASTTLKTLAGDDLIIPASEGVTVLVFWSTWSPRSEPLLRFWLQQREKYAAAGHPFALAAINADHQEMDGEKLAAVKSFVAEKAPGLPAAVDDSLALYNRIGVRSLPTTYYLKADGALVYEEAGFPTAASIDMPEELDRQMGIAREAPADTGHERGKLAYQPKNNALLYYNMGQNLAKMKMKEKARGKFVEALQRDPEYPDPLKALEDDIFRDGRTPEALQAMRDLMGKGNLPALAERYRE
jgi:tetratricopeptide (TPR) repeat protein